MRYHKQRFRHDPEAGIFGDCHRTAIACLLDLEPEQVPHFGQENPAAQEFGRAVGRFLATRNLADVHIAFKASLPDVLQTMEALNPGMYYLLGGTSKTGCGHTVIGCGERIVHDTSLNDSGIIGPMDDGHYWVTWLVPLSMKKHVEQQSSRESLLEAIVSESEPSEVERLTARLQEREAALMRARKATWEARMEAGHAQWSEVRLKQSMHSLLEGRRIRNGFAWFRGATIALNRQ